MSLVKSNPSVYDIEMDDLDEDLFKKSVFSKSEVQLNLEEKESETTENIHFSIKLDLISINLVFDDVTSVTDYQDTKAQLQEEKRDTLKSDIYWFIIDNPGNLTSEIVEKFEIHDTWEILEILDELKNEGLVD